MFRNAIAALSALFTGKPAGAAESVDRAALFEAGAVAAPPARPAARAQVTPRPEVLTGAFEPGFVGEAGDKCYPLRAVPLGEVQLPSGQVVGADPFIVSEIDKPFDFTVPPGRYPVTLAVADTGEGGHRVALARLLISDRPAVRWAMAVLPGQDPTTLGSGDIFGYGVDTGTGAFLDAGAAAWLAAGRLDALEGLLDDWQDRGEAHGPELGIPHGFALLETAGPGGAAMFSSGWGDGYYASWVGYDAEDRPVVLVTDFAVITAVDIPSP